MGSTVRASGMLPLAWAGLFVSGTAFAQADGAGTVPAGDGTPHTRRGRFNAAKRRAATDSSLRAGPKVTTTQEPNGPYRRPPRDARKEPAPPPIEPPIPWNVTRYRRGFYLRLAAGLGNGWNDASANDIDLGVLTGFSLGTQAAIGWYLRPGLAMALSIDNVLTTGGAGDLESGERLEEASAQSAVYGVLLDWYPWPRRGWHGQVSVGFGSYIAGEIESATIRASDHVAAGLGLTLAVGHEWWIGEQLSLGPMVRVLQTWSQTVSGVSFSHGAGGVSLMLSLSYY